MKTIIHIILIVYVILTTTIYAGCIQTKKKTSSGETGISALAEIKSINSSIGNFYASKNTDSLLDLYSPEFTCLPEYKPTIYSMNELRNFYAGWFNTVDIGNYAKKIYEVKDIGDQLLEIGNFSLSYSSKGKEGNKYTGKYMIIWRRNATGKLKILAEAFGSDIYIQPGDMPYAAVEVKDSIPMEKNILGKDVESEIEEFDKGVVNAVVDGDGEARANEFTQDGIYLPHFDHMQIGMEMIRPYMLKTYAPGRISHVQDTYREIMNNSEYLLLNGHFKVWLSKSNGSGYFEGNMLNLMKRGHDGKLLMYRQLAHN